MSYNNKSKNNNMVDYLNKDFVSLRNALIDYSKTYYPETYKDFNETSPGMMLMEMSAYVGDVLNFYVDRQFREMLLPLAQEKSNIIQLAKAFGYKTTATKPALVDLTFSQTINAITTDPNNIHPDFGSLSSATEVVPKGTIVKSSIDDSIIFETLTEIDFTSSSSYDEPPIPSTFDGDGLIATYKLNRTVKAIGGETKTLNRSVDAPSKFYKVEFPEVNVLDIVSCIDNANNKWYEVEYLTQDKIPLETHYTSDPERASAYTANDGSTIMDAAVPYSLKYISTQKRFITEFDPETDLTSIVFGNGLLRSGTSGSLKESVVGLEQVGLSVPGETESLSSGVDLRSGDSYGTLGEAPSNTVLTIKYRVGGGIKTNVNAGELSVVSDTNISVLNLLPARGGSDIESEDEIKTRALANFASQNRCVTKDDYFARIMNMPARFGSIAKAYVDRTQIDANNAEVGVVRIYILGYNNNKHISTAPELTKQNIKNYLAEYKMITDDIVIRDGYWINFGVLFDVTSHPHTDRGDLKIRVIQTIKDFFNIDKMQFKQSIALGELRYELLGLEGLRTINSLSVTQHEPPEGTDGPKFNPALYNFDTSGNITGNKPGYGYPYSLSGEALIKDTILPSVDPAVFELRDPDNNIKGVVK